MFERIPHSLSVVNVLRNPDHPNSWRTSQFTTGSERSKEPWLSSCLKEIHWNFNLLPLVINLRALDHPFKMVSGIQTTNQGYKQYSVYLKYMINLVYIYLKYMINIFYHQSGISQKYSKSSLYFKYLMNICYHQFRLHTYIYIYIEHMINLVYISNIWMNIFYHQSEYDRSGIYLTYMMYILPPI